MCTSIPQYGYLCHHSLPVELQEQKSPAWGSSHFSLQRAFCSTATPKSLRELEQLEGRNVGVGREDNPKHTMRCLMELAGVDPTGLLIPL